jgi:putative alpha-1,2-mannosidase
MSHSAQSNTLMLVPKIPGNDDSGAMAALLVFHLLGLYPVPSSKQFLLGSPFLSAFTLTNDLLGTTTSFTVQGFDPSTLVATPATGSKLYVQSVTVNGVERESVCWIGFEDVTSGGEVVITVGSSPRSDGCGSGASPLPDSLATGGFGPVITP